jgi:hypothetical protein
MLLPKVDPWSVGSYSTNFDDVGLIGTTHVAVMRVPRKMKAGCTNEIFFTVLDVILYDAVTTVFSTTIAVHRQSRLFDANPTESYWMNVLYLHPPNFMLKGRAPRATIVIDHGRRRLLALRQRSKS